MGEDALNINIENVFVSVNIYGGIGWSTLSDPTNKIILIAKPILESSISYIDMDQPLKPAIVVNLLGLFNGYGYKGNLFPYV